MRNRSIRSCAIGAVLLLAVRTAIAQIAPGSVVSLKQESAAVVLNMQRGVLRLDVSTPSIIHVRYSTNGSFPEHPDPMIVRSSWPAASYTLSQGARSVDVKTSALTVSIARKDGAIRFTDSQGRILLRSGGDSGGIVLTPATVNGERTYHAELEFFPSADEAFYGLGQHQAGVWDYAGEDVRLSQDNTNISIPFFVSSHGYGFFWNNASFSRFNDRFAQHLFISAELADTVDYYFLYGPAFDRIASEYRALTGQAQPGNRWITAPAPLGTMPLYVRAGSIVPLGAGIQYAGQEPSGPIELRVYPGADGSFTLYQDDGTTYDYENGAYATVPIRWDDSTHTLSIGARQGSFAGMARERDFNIVFVSPGHGAGVAPARFSDKTVHYNGSPLTASP